MLIYKGDDFAVRKSFAPENHGPVVVTFPHAGGPTMDRGVAFGQTFLQRNGIGAYHVLNAAVDWFQSYDLRRALDTIRADVDPGREIVTYGSSMGGYGALLASGPLKAARVLCVAPQFSIDRAIVPTERRWRAHAARIGTFIHDVEAEIAHDARIYSLHDPRNSDEMQINMFAPRAQWTRLHLPYSGHTPLVVLQQGRVLADLVRDIVHDRFDAPAWRPRILRARRGSQSYWRVLAIHAARLGRFDMAARCLVRFNDLGGTESERAVTQDAIDRSIDMRRRQGEQQARTALMQAERDARLAEQQVRMARMHAERDARLAEHAVRQAEHAARHAARQATRSTADADADADADDKTTGQTPGHKEEMA